MYLYPWFLVMPPQCEEARLARAPETPFNPEPRPVSCPRLQAKISSDQRDSVVKRDPSESLRDVPSSVLSTSSQLRRSGCSLCPNQLQAAQVQAGSHRTTRQGSDRPFLFSNLLTVASYSPKYLHVALFPVVAVAEGLLI